MKFIPRWVTYGANLALGKPCQVSVPSGDNWGAGDPEGKKLTDGIASLLRREKVFAYRYEGTRYDCGSKDGWLQANVELALRNLGVELARAKVLYGEFAARAVALGGTVAAEHGIGKLKTSFLAAMYGEHHMAQMRAVKNALDPDDMLGRGTLFPQ